MRQAVDKQNEQARAEGLPVVRAEPLLALAEQLLPRLRTAEWLDRATAALVDVDELDLRDLRSVVVAADTGARDDEGRALAGQLREALSRRVDEEQSSWLNELATTLSDGRVVRALRLSSRPPRPVRRCPPTSPVDWSPPPRRRSPPTPCPIGGPRCSTRSRTRRSAKASRRHWSPRSRARRPVGAVRRLASQAVPQIAALFGVQATPPSCRPPRRVPPRPPRWTPPVPPPRRRPPNGPGGRGSAGPRGRPGARSPRTVAPRPRTAGPRKPAEPTPAEPNPTAADPAVAAQQPSARARTAGDGAVRRWSWSTRGTPTAPGDDAPLASTADAHPTVEPS